MKVILPKLNDKGQIKIHRPENVIDKKYLSNLG
jgi:hypothetical protein